MLATVGTSVTLAGCGLIQGSPFWGTIANVNRRQGGKIDAARVASIPYASMVAHFKGSSAALLVLGEYQADQRLAWYSAQHQSLTTWGPFVERLIGLEVSLRSTSFEGSWNSDIRLLVGRHLAKRQEYQTKTGMVAVACTSTFRTAGPEKIEILGVSHDTVRYRESVLANRFHRYSNDYWIDPQTGFCWKSRQLVVPTMAPFEIEIAKPPRGS